MRTFQSWFIAVCLGIGSAALHAAKPNIIVISTSNPVWAPDFPAGSTNLPNTPNLDSLQQSAASFSQFYVSPKGPATQAEFLTGRHHPRGNVYAISGRGSRLDSDETTVAEVFKREGYVTGLFGRWHNGSQGPYHPNARGFDEFYGSTAALLGDYFNPLLEHNGNPVRGTEYVINDVTDHALAFIEANRSEPFFCYIPLETPPVFQLAETGLQRNFFGTDEVWEDHEPEPLDARMERVALAVAENADWNIGRILDQLDELDLTSDTLVMFFSESGLGPIPPHDPLHEVTADLDEAALRSSLLVRWPGTVNARRDISEPASAIDFLPTLTHLAWFRTRIDMPLDGRSLAQLIITGDPWWPERNLYAFWQDQVTVRSGNFRLDPDGRLFDVTIDPGQQTNVADLFPTVTARLSLDARTWREEVLSDFGPDHDHRPLVVGYQDAVTTRLVASEARLTGNVRLAEPHPGNVHITDWVSDSDIIAWDVEVARRGEYEAHLIASSGEDAEPINVELRFRDRSTTAMLTRYEDAEAERNGTFQSYNLGRLTLLRGSGTLELTSKNASETDRVASVWMVLLKRVR